jgi:hypothetical protein
MEAEASRILLNLVFFVIGIALFAGAIATRLQMEKEFKDGAQSLPSNFFLYLDSSDFSEKGNANSHNKRMQPDLLNAARFARRYVFVQD